MESISAMPAWFGTAIIGAVLAALGFVSKLILQWIGEIRAGLRSKRARLAELYSLLRAGKVAYDVQSENRNRLRKLLRERDPRFKKIRGFDRLFTEAYPSMTDEEQVLHAIVRTYTVRTIRELNEAVLQWLQEDTYFKARTWGKGLRAKVAKKLADLEVHILLWKAQFEIWIPDHPEHSLVYLADEQNHGIEFPEAIEDDLERLLRRKFWLWM